MLIEERFFRLPICLPSIEEDVFRSRLSCGTIAEGSFRQGKGSRRKELPFSPSGARGVLKMKSRLVESGWSWQNRFYARNT